MTHLFIHKNVHALDVLIRCIRNDISYSFIDNINYPVVNITRIGIIFHISVPKIPFGKECLMIDGYKFRYFKKELFEYLSKFEIITLDLISCSMCDNIFKNEVNKLKDILPNVTIQYTLSNNITDTWILESSGEYIKNIYFNVKIDEYHYQLGCNANNSAVIDTNNILWAYGSNNSNQLSFARDKFYMNQVPIFDAIKVGKSFAIGMGGIDGKYLAIIRNNGTIWVSQNFASSGVNVGNIDPDNYNNLIQVSNPLLTDVTDVTFGEKYMVVLRQGYVWTCGTGIGIGQGINFVNQLTRITNPPIENAIMIDSSRLSTVVLLNDGSVWTCGSNFSGQLGINSEVDQSILQRVWNSSGIPGNYFTNAIAVSYGSNHLAILRNDGTVWTCGENFYGQLGLGDTINRKVPIQVSISNIKAISCGTNFMAALDNNGKVWTWGQNGQGQLGLGYTTQSSNDAVPTPQLVAGISIKVAAISCSSSIMIVICEDGRCMSWGLDRGPMAEIVLPWFREEIGTRAGILGYYTPYPNINSTPRVVPYITDAKSICCTPYWTFVIGQDRSVWMSGDIENVYTDTSINYPIMSASNVEQITGSTRKIIITDAYAVSCSGTHAGLIRTTAGGTNSVWICGNGNLYNPIYYTNNSSVMDASAISCGYNYTVILFSNGRVGTYGSNESGQLGLGNYNNTSNVQQINSSPFIDQQTIYISAGYKHTGFVRSDNTVWMCGLNNFGQLGIGNLINQNIPQQLTNNASAISCGGYHTAILFNGNVFTFGCNNFGQLGLNDTNDRLNPVQILSITNAIAIACGYYHTVILCSDNTMWTCGSNGYGQLGLNDNSITDQSIPTQIPLPAGITPISIACGSNHTVFLSNDGTIWGFGYNMNGELGMGDNNNQFGATQSIFNKSVTKIFS